MYSAFRPTEFNFLSLFDATAHGLKDICLKNLCLPFSDVNVLVLDPKACEMAGLIFFKLECIKLSLTGFICTNNW